jgi:hypothetical protein
MSSEVRKENDADVAWDGKGFVGSAMPRSLNPAPAKCNRRRNPLKTTATIKK